MTVCGRRLLPFNISEYLVTYFYNSKPQVRKISEHDWPRNPNGSPDISCGQMHPWWGGAYILCEECVKKEGLVW